VWILGGGVEGRDAAVVSLHRYWGSRRREAVLVGGGGVATSSGSLLVAV
jgi:hypothetical protein